MLFFLALHGEDCWVRGLSKGSLASSPFLPVNSDPPAHYIPTPGSRSIVDLGPGWFVMGPGVG